MRKQLRNKILIFVSLGLALVLGAYFVFGPSGLLRVHRLSLEKRALDKQVQQLQAENERLSEQIHRLKNDKEYMERVIREKLGLVKPDETIIMFQSVPEKGSGYQ